MLEITLYYLQFIDADEYTKLRFDELDNVQPWLYLFLKEWKNPNNKLLVDSDTKVRITTLWTDHFIKKEKLENNYRLSRLVNTQNKNTELCLVKHVLP